MRITIIGAGVYGTALGSILESKGHQITYYSRRLNVSISDATKNAEILILSIPSKSLPEILPTLPTNLPLIIATKGILDPNTFAAFADTMVISGPGFANDIKHRLPTKLTATDQRIIDLFSTDWLQFDFTTDKKGVFLCGSLKNIYAIYAGMQDLEPHTLIHEQYLTFAAHEMKEILKANQANPGTVDLACGKGDLRLTCYYPSRNYEFGKKIAQDPSYKPEMTVEGLSALSKIKQGDLIVPDTAPILKRLLERSDKWV